MCGPSSAALAIHCSAGASPRPYSLYILGLTAKYQRAKRFRRVTDSVPVRPKRQANVRIARSEEGFQ